MFKRFQTGLQNSKHYLDLLRSWPTNACSESPLWCERLTAVPSCDCPSPWTCVLQSHRSWLPSNLRRIKSNRSSHKKNTRSPAEKPVAATHSFTLPSLAPARASLEELLLAPQVERAQKVLGPGEVLRDSLVEPIYHNRYCKKKSKDILGSGLCWSLLQIIFWPFKAGYSIYLPNEIKVAYGFMF